MKNIVVFTSGSGSNFQSIIDSISSGTLEATITVVLITDRENIQSLDRAKFHNIPYSILSPTNFDNPQQYETKLFDVVNSYKADIIILAGYLKKIPNLIIEAYRNQF